MTSVEIPTIIIGAGPAGLAVAGCLSHEKIPFLMLDQNNHIGSTWDKHYERLHLHTIKQLSALPYMAFPKDSALYPAKTKFIDYLKAYTDHFNIKPHFNQTVNSAYHTDGQWHVETQDNHYVCQNLVIATGYNQVPHIPSWPGSDQFQGRILHTSEYKDGLPFSGEKVLIIGFGNSGSEIAIDLWQHKATPEISIRGSVSVIFRDLLGVPIQVLSILLSPLPAQIIDMLTVPLKWLVFGNLKPYGITQAGAATQIKTRSKTPVIDVGTVRLIKQGYIKIRPEVRNFTEEGVVFVDGTRGNYQTVILATGLRPDLQFLKEQYKVSNTDDHPIFDKQLATTPGLYFCGFHNVATGFLREISIEAKRIARDIKKNYGEPYAR
jgi:indole-3-pyruvate monooxygenase